MKQEEMVKCFLVFFGFNRVTNHAWVYKIESDFIHVFTLQSTTK